MTSEEFCSACFTTHPVVVSKVPTASVSVPSSVVSVQTSSNICHVLFCSALGVGHYTPMCNTIVGLLRTHREHLRVTFFSPIRAWEVDSCPPLSTEYVQCVRVPLSGDDVHPITMNAMLTRRVELHKRLDEVLSSNYQGWPPVSVVVHDFFAIYGFEYAEKALRVPRIVFNSSHSLCFQWLADLDVNMRVARGERSMEVKGFKLPVDLQLFWQMMSMGPPEPVFLEYNVKRIARTALGMITTDLSCLFPSLLNDIKHLIATDRNLKRFFGTYNMFYVGPTCIFQKYKGCTSSDQVKTWLDSKDPRSVIYIALGTLYPIPLDALAALIDGIKTYGKPFVWAYNTQAEKRPEAVEMMKVLQNGTQGLVVDWVDQRMVLHHPALRGFITHGGWSSVVEAMTFAGIPLICVPLGSEQPINAILVKSAFEIGQFAMTEDLGWKNEVTEEQVEEVISQMQQDSTRMMSQMKPIQRCKYRYLNKEEWSNVLTEVFDTKYSLYLANAKEAQTNILKSTLPNAQLDQNFDSIAAHFQTLKGVSPPDSGDMSPC